MLTPSWAQDSNADQAEQGFRIMRDRASGNCLACHTLPGQSGILSNFAPPLHQVASRYSEQQLRQWVFDARLLKPDSLMPPYGSILGTNQARPEQPVLSEEQISLVLAALLTLR
ncbi:MAG: sulfur oxidation c-type cytochrome SoxX [Burkholderiaceae bacterium]